MTIYRVPVFVEVPYYTYTAQFDGRSYRLVFTYNKRSQSWYLDIADDDDLLIVAGARIGNDFPLARTRDQRMPAGMFVAISLETDNSDAGLADLGERVRLLYFTADELPTSTTEVDPPYVTDP